MEGLISAEIGPSPLPEGLMRRYLTSDIKDEIRRRVDLVDLASGHIALKKAGRYYKGLCPFHQEKTPSFHIDQEKGLWHCFGCFPPGQLVKTPFGYHAVETVTQDHPVISGKGEYQRVLATHERRYEGELVEIVTRKIRRPVRMTADHKVFVIRPTARHEVRFKYFSKRFRRYLRRYEADPGYYFRKITKWLPIREIEARELRLGDLLLYPLNDRVTPLKEIDLEGYVSRRTTRGPRPARLPIVQVDDNFLRLIGYFIAEGSTNRAYIRFSLGNHEELFAGEIVELIEKLFGLRASIHRRRGTKSGLEVTACHATLANAFENLCGRGAQEKHIPFALQEVPVMQRRVLIEAIARGDGTQFVANRSSHTHRSITTVSSVLAEQVVDALLAMGHYPGLHLLKKRFRNGVRHREAYTAVWSEEARPKYDLTYRTEGGERYWLLPIERLRRIRYRGPVYNLTVEKDHSYVVSHIAVSNCGKGGDVFDFVMQTSNLSFAEAAETLARRAGVQLERSPDEARKASERDRLYRALEAAAAFFREQLAHPGRGKPARDYLQRRGVDETTSDRFRLGYALNAWDELLRALGNNGYPPALLEMGGLVQPRQSGDGHYDLFRHRLMFPIVDLQDRVVAFGGRALDTTEPKYLNSKETSVFVKGRTLYALNWAREAIRRLDEIVVVEGNMDVLTAHQFGITNAVASLGTSLTADQVLVMKRLASRAVIVYDADASGQAAMERAMTLFEEADLPVRVVVLPAGDPDEFLRTRGAEALRVLLDRALPMFEYQMAMVATRHDARTVEGKVRIVDELMPALVSVANPVRQAEYVRLLAERFDLREDAVRQRLRTRRKARASKEQAEPAAALTGTDRARQQAERLLLHLMVHEPMLREAIAERLGAEDFADPVNRVLARAVLAAPHADAEVVRSALEDEAAERLLLSLLFQDPPVVEKDKERVVRETVEYIVERQPAARRRDALAKAIEAAQAAGDVEQVRRLQTEYLELVGSTKASRKGGDDHGQEKGGA